MARRRHNRAEARLLPAGRRAAADVELDELFYLARLHWVSGKLFLVASRPETTEIHALQPGDERLAKPILTAASDWRTEIHGPAPDGSVYLARILARDEAVARDLRAASAPGKGASPAPVYGLFRVDPDAGTIEDRPLFVDAGTVFGRRLSPSGRFWLGKGDPAVPGFVVRELPSGRIERTTGATARLGTATWLAGDRLAWVEEPQPGETALLLAAPGEEPGEIARWRGRGARLSASPDGELLLVETRPAWPPSVTEGLETIVYDIAGRVVWRRTGGPRYWAGRRTVALLEHPGLSLEPVAPASEAIEVF